MAHRHAHVVKAIVKMDASRIEVCRRWWSEPSRRLQVRRVGLFQFLKLPFITLQNPHTHKAMLKLKDRTDT